MVAQICYTKNHFKRGNFMACELHPNKKLSEKTKINKTKKFFKSLA